MRPAFTAVVAATGILVTGCGGAAWPQHAVAVVAAPATTAAPISAITTVDVLPLDLQLWAEPGSNANLDDVAARANMNIMNATLAALAAKQIQLTSLIDHNGESAGMPVLTREQLAATMGALGHYGTTATEHPGTLPVPYLPVRLGSTTGADATLYVGGWGYVAAHHRSTGDKIAEGLAIALVVVAAVAIVAALADAADHHPSSKSKSKSKSTSRSRDHRAASDSGGIDLPRMGHEHGGEDNSHPIVWRQFDRREHRGPSLGAVLVDAFGRAAIDTALSEPQWSDDPELPRTGPSQLYLEMTLVDNRTGLALWHAHQTFPAQAWTGDASRAARIVLATLPAQFH